MKYTVRCGSTRHKFDIDRPADFSEEVPVEVGKKTYGVRVHEKGGAGEIKAVSINNKVYSVQFRRRPDGFPYKVILNGNAYSVEIERVESTRFKPPAPEKKVDGVVKADLPGQISRLLVAPGEKVKEGQVLLVLEAMKMENEVASPTDGIVKTVHIKTGQLVTKNALLVEVE